MNKFGIKFILLIMVAATLTSMLLGCSIWSPDYVKPAIDTPSRWAYFESESLAAENNLAYTAWWQKFNDPVLNQLIESGLINNNSIGQAYGNLEQAKGQLKAVELSWLPLTSVYAGYSSNPAFGVPLGVYGIWPQYALFNMFNIIAMQKSAELKVASQEKAVDAAKLVLIGQIANSYYTYIAQTAQLKLYTQYQNDLKEILDVEQADYQDGISSEIIVKGLAQKVNAANVQQKIIENNIIKSQNALRYLINGNPGIIVSSAEFTTVNTAYPNVAALPATVLANRPDVAIAELEYHLAVQNKGGEYTQLLPVIQLDSFQGAANVGNPNPWGGLTTINDAYLEWTLDPKVFGRIEALKGAQKTAYYTYIDTVKKALRDVDNDLVNHKIADQTYSYANKAYLDAQQKYLLTLDLYTTGIDPYRTVLYSKLDVDLTMLEVNNMKLIQMITLVNLYQDLGGGYKYSNHSTEIKSRQS